MKKRQNDKIFNFSYYICIFYAIEIVGCRANLIINDALSTIDTLHFISLKSVCLTINNVVGKMAVSSNYFRDCVKYLFNQNDLF